MHAAPQDQILEDLEELSPEVQRHVQALVHAIAVSGSDGGSRPEATVGSRGNEPSTDEEFEWLRSPPQWARGKWVALLGSEAIASADTLAELVEALKPMELPRQPLVHHID